MSKEALIQAKTVSGEALSALLRRQDVWRGHSQKFVNHESVDSGSETLNQVLVHKGWPRACLIECLQANYAATWFVFSSVFKHMSKQGLVALLNPPAEPYALSLLQQGIDLDALLIVQTSNKADFIASFIELAKSPACVTLMAWQPQQALSYTELRKCQLASLESSGLAFLHRHEIALKQSSPATLRIRFSVQTTQLILEIVKQRGALAGSVVKLSLPDHWFSLEDYKYLDLHIDEPLYQQKQASPWLNDEKQSLNHKSSTLVSLRGYQAKSKAKKA